MLFFFPLIIDITSRNDTMNDGTNAIDDDSDTDSDFRSLEMSYF